MNGQTIYTHTTWAGYRPNEDDSIHSRVFRVWLKRRIYKHREARRNPENKFVLMKQPMYLLLKKMHRNLRKSTIAKITRIHSQEQHPVGNTTRAHNLYILRKTNLKMPRSRTTPRNSIHYSRQTQTWTYERKQYLFEIVNTLQSELRKHLHVPNRDVVRGKCRNALQCAYQELNFERQYLLCT